jgi:hypothetical protein
MWYLKTRQKTKLFLQPSALGLPHPQSSVPPPPPPFPLVQGEGAHSLTEEGGWESQFRRGDIHCTLYTSICTLWWYSSSLSTKITKAISYILYVPLNSSVAVRYKIVSHDFIPCNKNLTVSVYGYIAKM